MGEGVLFAEVDDFCVDGFDGRLVAFGFDDLVDPGCDLFHFLFFEASGCCCGGA